MTAQSTHSVWAPPILALLALMVATVRLEAQAAQRQHLDITMTEPQTVLVLQGSLVQVEPLLSQAVRIA